MRTKQIKSLVPFKRILSAVLCFVMLFTLFQTVALAGGETIVSVSTEDQLIQAVNNAGTTPTIIEVTENITFSNLAFFGMSIEIKDSADITIRASGKDITLSKDAGDSSIFDIKSGGKLTLSSD